MSDSLPGPPLPKGPKRLCHFDPSWIQKFPGIGTSFKGMYVIILEIHISCRHNNTGNTYARCTYCESDFSISSGGLNAVTTHVRGWGVVMLSSFSHVGSFLVRDEFCLCGLTHSALEKARVHHEKL